MLANSRYRVTLPGLTDVRGAFTLVSDADITDSCNTFKSESGTSAVIKTTPNCQGMDPNALTEGGNGTSTSSGSSSTTSSSTANAVVITGATGLLGVVAAIFGML